MTGKQITGGCQCGAVRYSISGLGRASICHCRMCQKAFGNFYGPLVHATDLEWTRGEPKMFASSNKVQRGFCGECGTPLLFDFGKSEITIGSLDNPELAPPEIQVNPDNKLSYVDALNRLPTRGADDAPSIAEFMNSVVSNQHPDCDTDHWPEDEK